MICAICLNGCDHAAKCAGSNCEAVIGACCFEDDGLCDLCRAESAKRVDCPPLSAELMALLLSGLVPA